MVNISTRGRVGRDEDVLISGFILEAEGGVDVVVRAIGPSLEDKGVADALQNPQLALVDGNGNSVVNDDWQDDQRSEIQATKLEPKDPREAAIRARLTPENYTGVVRGKGGSTGVGLVEFYSLPPSTGQ